MEEKHRVIILGGGFGGLAAAKKLKRAPVEVTLIDKRNFHLFQPLMYQVATGSLSPGEIAAPLRGVLSRQQNTQVLLGEAADVDPVAKRVTLCDGATFEYDSLIVATGSQTSYYGNDSWREWAPSLKSVEEATAIRHKILYAFERAERAVTEEEARAWLTFVIVGAGATGLELSGALAEIARETLRHDFRKIRPQEARIILLEGTPSVLGAFPEDLSAKAEKLVTRLGVEVVKGVMVTKINKEGVEFKRGDSVEALAARTVLWAGGVVTTPFGRRLAERTKAETDRSGRIKVNRDLTIPNYPDIFILGDLALRPLDLHCGISKSRDCFHSMGIRIPHVQPRRALDYRRVRHGSNGPESPNRGRRRLQLIRSHGCSQASRPALTKSSSFKCG